MDTHLSVFFVFFIREFVNRPWSAICCVVPTVRKSDIYTLYSMIQAVYAFENAICFILECCLYNKAREELKLRLVFLHELKIEVLLFGHDTLTEMQNLQIFKSVQLYIKRTKRFTHLWSQPPNILFLIKQSINFISNTSMIKHAYIRLFHAFLFFLYFLLLRLLFFFIFQRFIYNVVYCILLLLTHVLLQLFIMWRGPL